MKCPYCHSHIAYPTRKQLLAWTYRYFGRATWDSLMPVKEVAKRMNTTEDAVLKLLQGLRRCWPAIAPKKALRRTKYVFDESRDSEPRIQF